MSVPLVNIVTVVIVNWNSGDQLRTCVESVQRFGAGIVREVIVVDNDSADDSAASVMNLPNTRVLLTGMNLGFGKACNLGARHAETDYLLFLNPDAAIKEGTLEIALRFMENPANSKVGIAGVQLVGEDGHVSRSCARYPTLAGFIAHAVGLDRFVPRAGHAMAEWPHDESRYVDHVIGAFFLMRHSLFRRLHGFDEAFFMYYEDLDLSYRAHQAGWRSYFIAEAQAFHAGGGTSRQIKARRLFYSLRSRLIYSKKHFSGLGHTAIVSATFFAEPFARSVNAGLQGAWSSLKETWSAYRMLSRWYIIGGAKGPEA